MFIFAANTECPPPDPPELARRIMAIYDGEDDGHDYDDDSIGMDNTHVDENHLNSRKTPPESRENCKSPDDDNIKQETSASNTTGSITPSLTNSRTAHLIGHTGSTLNVPMRRGFQRDGLLDYRLLDAARMEER